MRLSPPMVSAAVRSKAVALLMLVHCLLSVTMMLGFAFGPCFVVQYVLFFLVLK